MNDPNGQVLIVGGGPAGLAAAFLLARAGVPVLLAERRAAVSAHPRARGLNVRSMELFRGWGLADQLIAAAGPIAAHSLRIWAERLAGPERRRDRTGQGPGLAGLSPAAPCLCPQYGVESVLRDAAAAAGADLRYAHELVAIEWHGPSAVAVVAGGSDGGLYRVPARYVLAADGARSTVRGLLGIRCTGPGLVARNLSIHFQAELSAYLAGRDLLWCRIDNDSVNGLLMPVTARQWLLVVPDPGGDPRCEDLVSAAIGAPADVAVLGVQRYDVTSCVASRFRVGNVFLLGDAAHQWPPAGAFGMNAGIQDAHNLAWKIAAVLDGWAGPGLLDSYQAERRPLAEELMSRAGRYLGMLGMGGPAERPDPLGRPAWDLAAALGARYRSAACGNDDPAGPAICDELTVARVGARAPHLPLPGGRSVLDLFGQGYLLLGGPDADPAWVSAVEAVRARIAVPLRYWPAGAVRLDRVTWADRYGCGRRVVLVRPDGHVAWIWEGPAGPDALGRVLTRQTASEGGHMAVDYKADVSRAFQAAADRYDGGEVSFFSPMGRLLVERAGPRPGDRVLDIGCGRGACTFAAAEAVGPEGSVVGIDIAPAMVDRVRDEAGALGLRQVSVTVMDAEHPHFAAGSFDMVVGSFSVIYLAGAPEVLHRYVPVLVPGGQFAFTAPVFDDRHIPFLPSLFTEIITDSVLDEVPPQWRPRQFHERLTGWLADPSVIAAKLAGAGFEISSMHIEPMPMVTRSGAAWVAWSRTHGMRLLWDRLSQAGRARLERAIIERLDALRGPDGLITMDLPVRFVVARTPDCRSGQDVR